MSVGKEDVQKYTELRREFIAQIPPYPEGRSAGRGIVINAGGQKYFTCAWVAVQMLRRHGCTLPIEFWHLGPAEMDDRMRALVEPWGVTCVDGEAMRRQYPVRSLGGWEMKAFALLHTRFEEVLFLDADNVPCVDPTFLFNTPQYMDTGAVFWPDYGRLGPKREIWEICGLPYNDEPEFESGQIVFNKRRCWREMQLTMHLNEHSDFYYKYVHGDKETFHMAWKILGTRYSMPIKPIQALRATMCQHDFQGHRIFQHRNMAKWELHKENTKIAGFLYEPECLQYLEQLKTQWSGKVELPVLNTDEGRATAQELIGIKTFNYVRVGHDKRVLDLAPGGVISKGGGDREKAWFLRQDPDGPVELCIIGNALTCALVKGDDGIWRGRWESNERMPVEFSPVSMERTQLSAGHQHDHLVAGKIFVYNRVGYDKRVIELLPNGLVGKGAQALEQLWGILDIGGKPVLRIGPTLDNPICELTLQQGIWKGRWTQHEKMPIELSEDGAPVVPVAAPVYQPVVVPVVEAAMPVIEAVRPVVPKPTDPVAMKKAVDLARLDRIYTYHAPKADQPPRYTLLRDQAKALAARIVENCPDSRERSLALTAVEEAVMWANAAIARNEV